MQTIDMTQKVRTAGPGSCFALQLLPLHPDGPRMKSASRTADPSQASFFEMLSASLTLIFDNLSNVVYGTNSFGWRSCGKSRRGEGEPLPPSPGTERLERSSRGEISKSVR